MKVLVTGANGFIAQGIIKRLKEAGHQVVGTVRRRHDRTLSLADELVEMEFHRALSDQKWLPLLDGIDCVINCVGVFQTAKLETMWAIHADAPQALFQACVKTAVKKVIQISALAIDQVDTPYATSKLAADQSLQQLPIDSAIIRPSFVYAQSCYGGSAFFRGLVGIPFVTPLPGGGKQLVQPILLDDLARIVEQLLDVSGKQLITAVGSERLSLATMLQQLQRWLGFQPTKQVAVPLGLIKPIAKLGNAIRNSPVSETALKMLPKDNVASEQEYEHQLEQTGFTPKDFNQGLAAMPSTVQDRWHARLFFLKPLLRVSLAFLWLFTGVISLIYPHAKSFQLLGFLGLGAVAKSIALYGASLLDFALGCLLLINWRTQMVLLIQLLMIMGYTLIITFALPAYWLHPFGPISKNIPIIVATLILMALEPNR